MGENDGSSAVWSIETRHEVVALLERAGAIDKIAFSPDGSEVATASEDGIVRIWHASGPELDDVYLQGSIESVALSGKRVVVASLDAGRVEISYWRTWGQELGHFLIPLSSSNDIVSLSVNGGYVADVVATPCTSGLACSLVPMRVFDVGTGRLLRSYPVPGAEAITWSHDGREIAVASTTLEVVNLATGVATPLAAGGEQCGEDGRPVFSGDDSLVAWATRCGTVAVFSVKGPQLLSFTVEGQPSGVAFNRAGTEPQVWDARRGQLLRVDQTSAPVTALQGAGFSRPETRPGGPRSGTSALRVAIRRSWSVSRGTKSYLNSLHSSD